MMPNRLAELGDRSCVSQCYTDPLDAIWLHSAAMMGMRVVRDSSVFASWDGNGTLRIGVNETLDADDCLAQMILHEFCHALVEGPDAFGKPDWGIDITDRNQQVRELACLRLQAALTEPYGLRSFFASTTSFRKFYDSLTSNPLGDTDDPSSKIAQAGWKRAMDAPWRSVLKDALEATAAIARAVKPFVGRESLWFQASCGATSE